MSADPRPDPRAFFVAGGTLWGEASSYITRPTDEELFELARAGEYGNILAARQMGKSSLMVRTAGRLREAGVRTAIIDISTLGGGISTPEAWFYGFIDELAGQLDLDAEVDTWWEANAGLNAIQRFSNFLRDVVLVEIGAPITVFIDEIDSALGMAFTDDFFAAIRAAYNARAVHPEFQRLTFVLIGVARPADLIRDRNRTPYNIGTHIALDDFTLEELSPYEDVLEAALPGHGHEILEWVVGWTGGQPYLTQKVCAELIREEAEALSEGDIEETVTRLFFTDRAQKESNLQAIRDRIESSPLKNEMLEIYRKILLGRDVPDEDRSPAKNELKLSGLVRADGSGRLVVRNRTYRRVFDMDWVRMHLPVPRARRIAYATTALAVVAILVAVWAIDRARRQEARTFENEFNASSSADVRLTSLARLLALDAGAAARAGELFYGLPAAEQAALFTDLSDPQAVAAELVAVAGAFYQPLGDTAEGEAVLGAIRDALGGIGAAGAPGLKTELEFWLKGREEAAQGGRYAIAVSLLDSAWAESERRGQPNYRVRYDRALALIALGEFEAAMEDLNALLAEGLIDQAALAGIVNGEPALAFYVVENGGDYPGLDGLVTPVAPTAVSASAPAALSTTPGEGTPIPAPTPRATEQAVEAPAPVSPYAGWIAVARGAGEAREIVIFDPKGSSDLQLTGNTRIDEAPSFSGDNWRVVFAADLGEDGWGLFVYDLAENALQEMPAFGGEARFPAYSPVAGDGRVVFEGRTGGGEGGGSSAGGETGAGEDTGSGGGEGDTGSDGESGAAGDEGDGDFTTDIWLLDTATGDYTQLTDGGADARPIWSPDGTHIAFGRAVEDTTGDGLVTTSDNQDLYILDLESGTLTNLTGTPAEDDFNFAWSPDGEWIVFTSVQGDADGDGVQNLADSRGLHFIRPDGSGRYMIALDDAPVYTPGWRPDGNAVLYLVSHAAGENELRLLDLGSEESVPLGEIGPVFHPAFAHSAPAPAGANYDLAFVSDRDGEYGVYVMDTGNLESWALLPRPAGFERAWWPSFCGEYILYEAQDRDGLEPQWLFFYTPDVSEPIRYRSSLDPAQLGVPRCSPDGDRIAFSIYLPNDFNGWQVAVNDAAGGSEYVLADNPSFGYVSWSNRVDFFLSMTIIEGDFYVLQTSNYAASPVLSTLARGKYPALSPNGNRFVFLCSNQAYLCIQDVDGGTPELLVEVVSIRVAGEDVPVTAVWSADGAWIYFASAADGDWDIYRIRPNGTGLQNLTSGWESNELMPVVGGEEDGNP